jgi:hypothetical protein
MPPARIELAHAPRRRLVGADQEARRFPLQRDFEAKPLEAGRVFEPLQLLGYVACTVGLAVADARRSAPSSRDPSLPACGLCLGGGAA